MEGARKSYTEILLDRKVKPESGGSPLIFQLLL
jgi:hypothetical protein